MYKVENISDMVIAGISPGNCIRVRDKDLSAKHIKYHNKGFLIITKEEDKKVVKKPTTIPKEDDTINKLKEKEEVNE